MTVEEAGTARGRTPIQARSRERVDRILAVASDLVGARGSGHLKMSELAARAGISIGSLYQYFPDKAAVIRGLVDGINAESRRCIEEALAPVATPAGLARAWNELIDIYWGLFQARPVMRDIWAGVQADKRLVEIEVAENRANGALLTAAILRARPTVDAAQAGVTAFLAWQLGEAAMRLAISLPRSEGDAVVAAYKRMSLDAILSVG